MVSCQSVCQGASRVALVGGSAWGWSTQGQPGSAIGRCLTDCYLLYVCAGPGGGGGFKEAGVSFSRWEFGVSSSSSSSSRMHTTYGRSAVLVPSETRDLVTISILDGGGGGTALSVHSQARQYGWDN